MILKELRKNITTEYKETIHKKHGIPIKNLAKYLGLTYSHTANLLSGVARIMPETQAKLDSLIRELEREETEKPKLNRRKNLK